jgi:hypothetical protein
MSLLLLLQHEYADSLISDDTEELAGTGTAPQEWTFVLANSSGTATDILDPAVTACELTYTRSQPSTAVFTLQGEDDRAYNIISALTTTRPLVYAYRDSVLYFAGFLSGVRESGDEDLSMTVTFTDALGVLAYRLTDSDVEIYDQTTTNLIAGTAFTPVVTGALTASNGNTTFTRTAAGAGWDAQAYSVESYTSNCYATAKAASLASKTVFGLNSDPTTDAHFTGIDYAWNLDGTSNANIYEGGVLILAGSAYTTSTVLTITYDGTNVRYLKDGAVVRTVARAVGAALYFDSSFNTSAGALTSVAFGTRDGASLVDQANLTAPTGLVATVASSGFTVETFATSRDVVLDKVTEIVQLTNGPDLKVKPVDGSSTFGVLQVGTLYQGTTVMAYFGYGSSTVGNLTGFDWEITPPATRVICVGNEVEGSSTVNAAVTSAESRIGVWQASINNNDLYLENDCIDAANAATRLDWQTVVSFTPEPAITPRPLRDYTVGDVVSVRASRGSLLYAGSLRVTSIAISIDDSGFEVAHRVECEAGGPGTSQQQGVGGGSADSITVSNGLAGGFV